MSISKTGPSSTTHRYRAYGLVIGSNADFPELVPAPDTECDVRVVFDDGTERPRQPRRWTMSLSSPEGGPWLSHGRDGDRHIVAFAGMAHFSIDREGRNIRCIPAPGMPSQTLRHLLLDQVLPMVLSLRERQALHAAAVLTPFGACAFTGAAGAGKSTLALSFLVAGYPVLSDDCLLLGEEGDRIVATPAYPGLRLHDDTFRAVCGEGRSSAPVAHYTSKRRVFPDAGRETFAMAPQGLARIYALESAAPTARAEVTPRYIERLSARDGLMELLGVGYRLDIEDSVSLLRQLRFLERVVARVPVQRLRIPRTFDALPDIRAAILADREPQGRSRAG